MRLPLHRLLDLGLLTSVSFIPSIVVICTMMYLAYGLECNERCCWLASCYSAFQQQGSVNAVHPYKLPEHASQLTRN